MNGELQLSITPSLVPTFNANIPFTPKATNRKHHLDFFRRLTKYAFQERRMYIERNFGVFDYSWFFDL